LPSKIVQLSENKILKEQIDVELLLVLLDDQVEHLDKLMQIVLVGGEVGLQQEPKRVEPDDNSFEVVFSLTIGKIALPSVRR
jgi:hypothetical protein